MNEPVACTVGEGNYHHGLAALCNSLCRHGYQGAVWVGWRGDLPPWAADATSGGGGRWRELDISDGVVLRFVALEEGWNPANQKPAFMRRLLGELAPEASGVIYFDADIVLCCGWGFFEEWIRHGAALVQDMFDPAMLPSHVFKRRWRAYAERLGFHCRDVAGHYNSGFVGVRREDAALLEAWEAVLRALEADGADMTRLRTGDKTDLFHQMDQSALNVAVLASPVEIATGGQEMMEFYPWGEVMAHCIHFEKPWRRRYLVDALMGFPPGRPHLAYWRNAAGPIRSWSPAQLARRRAEVSVARAIGKLHNRSLLY